MAEHVWVVVEVDVMRYGRTRLRELQKKYAADRRPVAVGGSISSWAPAWLSFPVAPADADSVTAAIANEAGVLAVHRRRGGGMSGPAAAPPGRPPNGSDDGTAGVREPRRPRSPTGSMHAYAEPD